MKKIIMVEIEKEEIFCDICKKKVKGKEYNICSICDREICYFCMGTTKHIHSIGITPCPACVKVMADYPEEIEKMYEIADKYRAKGFEAIKKWAKDSKGENNEEQK